ncbi:MAG: site-2 protease family protein [Streptosporangiaceae bacterium]
MPAAFLHEVLPGLSIAFAGLLVIITVHELGHTIAAVLCGLVVDRINVYLIAVERGPRGWRLVRLAKPQCSVHARSARPGMPSWRPALVNAAGPAAALALGGAGLLAAAAVRPERTALLWLSAIAAADCVINLVPFRLGQSRTDGSRIGEWLRHPADGRVREANTALMTEASWGIRPRNWSPEWLAAVAGQADDPTVLAAGQYLAYVAARDAGRADHADWHLRAALAVTGKLSPALGGTVHAEAAYHAALVWRDPAWAREYLRRVPRLSQLSPAIVRAQAAIALAAGNWDRAIEASERVLAAPDSAARPGMSVALKDWTAQIRAEAIAADPRWR